RARGVARVAPAARRGRSLSHLRPRPGRRHAARPRRGVSVLLLPEPVGRRARGVLAGRFVADARAHLARALRSRDLDRSPRTRWPRPPSRTGGVSHVLLWSFENCGAESERVAEATA